MNLNDRMIQFRLASRNLYNTFFYTASRDEAVDAEERYSNVLEALFLNMVSYPEKLQEVSYYETQSSIEVLLKNEPHRIYFVEVEINQGNWETFKISKNNMLRLSFKYFFDWDDLAIKDNRYVRGIIISFPENEELVGKTALIEANDAIFQKA
ncbi:MAG: hypothetical protein U1C48_07320 [Methylotenera sp.]|nr:hypothetical protein [Methylotenera sp.]